MKSWMTIIMGLGLGLTVLFQNCGDVRLAPQPKTVPSVTGQNAITAQICPSTSPQSALGRFRVSRVFVTNLTVAFWQGQVRADSDMDGVADDVEASLGLQVGNRRSVGVLDGLCMASGGPGQCAPPPTCTPAVISPGLTQCDFANFRSPRSSGGFTGLDEDMDDIPTLLEAVRGISPISDDAYLDYDSDGTSNLLEMLAGSDPNDTQPVPPGLKLQYRFSTAATSCPGGDLVDLSIDPVPVVQTQAFTDLAPFIQGPVTVSLSHGVGENVVAIYVVTEPELNATLHKELYFALIKVSPTGVATPFALTAADFIFLGEITP